MVALIGAVVSGVISVISAAGIIAVNIIKAKGASEKIDKVDKDAADRKRETHGDHEAQGEKLDELMRLAREENAMLRTQIATRDRRIAALEKKLASKQV